MKGSNIVPMLSYENGVAAMEWLCRVFGFTEQAKWLDESGNLSHGEIAMGNDMIMLATPTAAYQSPKHHRSVCDAAAKWSETTYIINGVLVYVDDVMLHYATAVAHGATILSPPVQSDPGLLYRAEDLEGQRWMFLEKPKQG